MYNQSPSMFKAALISGIAFGVVGAIPYLEVINCLCCALIVGSGFTAAFLYSKDCRAASSVFGAGAGTTIGVLAGLIAGATTGVLSAIISRIRGMDDWREAIEQLQMAGADIPPETMDQIISFMETSGPTVIQLILVFAYLLFGAIFGAVGGLIGGSVFKVEVQPAGGYTQTPPPPPPVG